MDGAATARVELVRETAPHEVRPVVRPERGEAYASLDPLGDGDPLAVRDDGSGDGTTTSCKTESRCTCDVCDLDSRVYQERTCCTDFDDPDYDCGAWSDEGCGCCCCG